MYVSFTDWKFDGDVDKAVEGIKATGAMKGPLALQLTEND